MDIAIDALAGQHISQFAEQLIATWEEHAAASSAETITVRGMFNEIPLAYTGKEGDVDDLLRAYDAERTRRYEAYRASPAYQADLDRQAAQAREDKKKRLFVRGALAVAPPLALRNPGAWQQGLAANMDAYGAEVYRYAECWGRLMQSRLAQGETITDCAATMAHLADTEGITGFMYGCAVSILAECWEHGEALRHWHNLVTQIGTEGAAANRTGGTLNPALLRLR